MAVDNASAPVYASVVITGMTTTVTNRQAGTHFVARTPEAFGYDSDGNLTNDGRFAYFWDAENRLIAAEELTAPSGRGRVRVENRYDSQSRRFRKLVYTRSADLWSLTSDLFFLYDGWNLIREERRPDAKNRTMNYAYTWGLDLSGTAQGAGGIGGLLAASYGHTSAVASVFYTFDGNGNVSDLIAANGTLAAHYEFDPFGNTLVATGPLARENTFRFSTKYTEEETGLVYYGYRYYSPILGRWVSRDALDERISANLFAFVANEPLAKIDYMGHWGASVHKFKTIGWAGAEGYKAMAAIRIGREDEAVDSPPTGPLPFPWIGDQSYHFDRNIWGGPDTRLQHHDVHLAVAKLACTKFHLDDPEAAVKNLGKALHPLQDWVAHGDFGIHDLLIVTWHNAFTPQLGIDDTGVVDDPEFDATGTDGRVTGSGYFWTGPGGQEYGIFSAGNLRVNKTESLTRSSLREFIDNVRNYGDCKCKKYFLP